MRDRMRAALFMSAAVLMLAPRSARADIHGWTICTPGSFHSCHSVSIGAQPIMTGSVRTGTGITITVTNLQGSGYPFDNTSLSGLFQVFFSGRNFPFPMLFSLGAQGAALTGPGASGGVTFTTETGINFGTQITHYATVYPFSSGVIGGCASGVVAFGYVTSAHTCGAGAAAVFSFTSGTIFDARQMETVFVESLGANDVGFCFSDPSAFDTAYPACDVQDQYLTVTPEPISMALLGTGLFGIGGARLRRRRRNQTA